MKLEDLRILRWLLPLGTASTMRSRKGIKIQYEKQEKVLGPIHLKEIQTSLDS